MNSTVIISDLHIGSPICQVDRFLAFLDELAAEATLVLNGDTASIWFRDLPDGHQRAIDRLRTESRTRRIVWVRGNHDNERYELSDPAEIEFADHFAIGKRLYVTHGDRFDKVARYGRPLLIVLRLLNGVRSALGGKSLPSSSFARSWPRLYGVFRNHVTGNAVRFAQAEGYAAVACGHTHYVEDTVIDGVRYINTGSWLEEPVVSLSVTDDAMILQPVPRLV